MRGTGGGGGGGEIVEVQGGHIVRSIGRKDRHSKVCTAKGARDRRVRLSAHTAIQFYDVQDRLGFDRPSKAVDWLIKKAKAAIDELAELPAWNPTATPNAQAQQQQQQPQHNHNKTETENLTTAAAPSSSSSPLSGGGIGGILCQQQQQLGENPIDGGGGGGGGFLPPPTSLDVDIADTIRSFFPTTTMTSSPIQFQSFPPDLLSRTSSSSQNNNNNSNSNNQDLRLSLQSFQDPILLHQHQAQTHHHQHHHQNDHVLFSGTAPLGFDAMVAWNAGVDTGNAGHGGGGGGGGGGFMFNTPSPSPSPLPSPAAFFGQSQYLSQRGPLQSSNTPSIRAWIDAPSIAAVADDHHHHYLLPAMVHQSSSSSVSGIGFASGGFSGFRVPARIQGEEEHDGVSDKPSSASSDSRR